MYEYSPFSTSYLTSLFLPSSNSSLFIPDFNISPCGAVVVLDSRWFLTERAKVTSQASPYVICVLQVALALVLLRVLQFSTPCILSSNLCSDISFIYYRRYI